MPDAMRRMLMNKLFDIGEGAPPFADRLRLRDRLIAAGVDRNEIADACLERFDELGREVAGLRENHAQLKELTDQLTEPPNPVVRSLGVYDQIAGPQAAVLFRGAVQMVALHPDVDPESVRSEPAVLLNGPGNLVIGAAPASVFAGGELARVRRRLSDGRLELELRDEGFIAQSTGALADVEVRPGDLVRIDRSSGFTLALERIEPSKERRFVMENPPDVDFSAVGGHEETIRNIVNKLKLFLFDRRTADQYPSAKPTFGILFVGAPGNGKTLIARAVAGWLRSVTGRSRFINVAPGSLRSMWYGQTEHNISDLFGEARRAAEEDGAPILIYFDELDSIASMRGESATSIDDRVSGTLLAAMDGLESRGDVIVLASTNRPDMLDLAMVRRFGEQIVEIGRPGRGDAAKILDTSLLPGTALAPSGELNESELRERLIEAAVANLYCKSDSPLCTVTLRSGERRDVRTPHLISGADLARVVAIASEHAAIRHSQTGRVGVTIDDVIEACEAEKERLSRLLSEVNASRYLTDLPRDAQVIRVERVDRSGEARRRTFRRIDREAA